MRRIQSKTAAAVFLFQSTHPSRGATAYGFEIKKDFYNFNPRTPRGVRRLSKRDHVIDRIFQSTHPSRGATFDANVWKIGGNISIHAPLAGCDGKSKTYGYASSNFNPRTPRGVRPDCPAPGREPNRFQSTHPSRGATCQLDGLCFRDPDFNPRTPRGVRQSGLIADVIIFPFQSTHPSRGATPRRTWAPSNAKISIHAPLAGCDQVVYKLVQRLIDFNPRTPRGVRLECGVCRACA